MTTEGRSAWRGASTKRKTPPMAAREGRTAAPGAFGSHQTNNKRSSLTGVPSSSDGVKVSTLHGGASVPGGFRLSSLRSRE